MDTVTTAELALEMLRKSPGYRRDARNNARVSQTIVGAIIAIQHGIPRENAESAVRDAMERIDNENRQ